MREMAIQLCILNTHISFSDHVIEGDCPLSELVSLDVNSQAYDGRLYIEIPGGTRPSRSGCRCQVPAPTTTRAPGSCARHSNSALKTTDFKGRQGSLQQSRSPH
jgi:hypothetical protein